MAVASVTREHPSGAPAGGALIEARGLTKLYPVTTGFLSRKHSLLSAVEDVDLEIGRGETLGLVGESGSGKSTVARLITRLIEPTRGQIAYDGHDITGIGGGELRQLRRKIQIVFQDPYSSLNPRHSVRHIIGEGIESTVTRRERSLRVAELLELVGLSPDVLGRYPHEFSGGQRQRIVIARALAVRPECLVLDEPVSALDVSIQSKILNLLYDLRKQLSLTYLFISHDLSVVRHIADRVAVMYLGHVVETATKRQLYANPLHPYTQGLLSAVPSTKHRSTARTTIAGEIQSPIDIPAQCRFASRCPRVIDRCKREVPRLQQFDPGHHFACFNPAVLDHAAADAPTT